MSSTHLLPNDSGFTIIEALIALVIFSIGLLAMGALQAHSLMDTGDVAAKTEAWTIADERATLLKEMEFWDVPTWSTPAALTDTTTATPHMVTHANGRYDVYWEVEDDIPFAKQNASELPNLPAGMYTVYKQITVSVTPVGGKPPNDTIAEIQFIKSWWATGIPN
jgi:prepilin-type N-terminal cleavage/methylation domain-containing protein